MPSVKQGVLQGSPSHLPEQHLLLRLVRAYQYKEVFQEPEGVPLPVLVIEAKEALAEIRGETGLENAD